MNPIRRRRLLLILGLVAGIGAATFGDLGQAGVEVGDQGLHGLGIGLEVGGARVELAVQHGHGVSWRAGCGA